MDVKRCFEWAIKEEVYVAQPKGFKDPYHLGHAFKLKKSLYGLKQAPKAWYARLIDFLMKMYSIKGELIRRCSYKGKGGSHHTPNLYG